MQESSRVYSNNRCESFSIDYKSNNNTINVLVLHKPAKGDVVSSESTRLKRATTIRVRTRIPYSILKLDLIKCEH